MSDSVIHRDALPPGTMLREFELMEVLGRGGFGITYLGWHTNLGITVAVKEYMPPPFAIREADGSVYPKTEGHAGEYEWGLNEFLKEARTLARFDHPSIVRVRDFFRTHGTACMVMDHLKGRTLYSLYEDEQTLNESRLRALLTPILAGLELVHAAKTHHLDIKPGNIMLTDDGTPVLIDFGAAEIATAEHSQLVQAVVMPGYSPFEQYGADRRHHGAWTDIYALGAVLYRGMTGFVPTDAPSRMQDDDLEPAAEASRGRYGRSLTDAVDFALRLRISDRPQSIDQFRDVLEGRVAPPPPTVEPPTYPHAYSPPPPPPPPPEPHDPAPEEGMEKKPPHRRWLQWVAVPVAALMLAGGTAWLMGLIDEREDNVEPPEGLTTVDSNDSPNVTQPTDTEYAEAALVEARRLLGDGNFDGARAKLKEVAERLPENDYRIAMNEIDKAANRLAECEAQVDGGPMGELLACYRGVLELAPRHAGAEREVLRYELYVDWREADEARSAERYEAFVRETEEKLDSLDRADLGKTARHLMKLARTKMESM